MIQNGHTSETSSMKKDDFFSWINTNTVQETARNETVM